LIFGARDEASWVIKTGNQALHTAHTHTAHRRGGGPLHHCIIRPAFCCSRPTRKKKPRPHTQSRPGSMFRGPACLIDTPHAARAQHQVETQALALPLRLFPFPRSPSVCPTRQGPPWAPTGSSIFASTTGSDIRCQAKLNIDETSERAAAAVGGACAAAPSSSDRSIDRVGGELEA